MLALRQEQADTCELCGHPKRLCHDRNTRKKWKVEHGICQATVAAAVVAERGAATKTHGLTLATRYTG